MRELRDGLSALAAQPGATSERLGVEQDALANLHVAAHQVVGRDQFVLNLTNGTGPALRSTPLGEDELDQLNDAFVPPPDFARLAADTRDQALVLLCGPRGVGGQTTALALLRGSGVRRLLRVDPASDLSRVSREDFEPGCGYVLSDAGGRAAASLSAYAAQNLAYLLRTLNCRMAVVFQDAAPPHDPDLARAVLSAPAPPPSAEVTRAHLLWHAGPAGAPRAARLLARDDVTGLIAAEAHGQGLARAAELGRLLAVADDPEDAVADRVSRRLALRDDSAFARWLQDLPDLDAQCLALATAVFGGEAYETVAALGDRLRDLLRPPESAEHPDRPRNAPFGATRSLRLRSIDAVSDYSEVPSRHGGTRGMVVRFRDPGMAARVLDHVWHEYDAVRDVVPSWLRACAAHELPTVGVRAAVAAGSLARHGFESVRVGLLQPWAADENPALRDAAATALRVTASDGVHAAAVRNLIGAWAATDTAPALQATAARAWRVALEHGGRDAAWGLLHGLAAVDDPDVVDAVCTSMTEYFALDDGAYQDDALDLVDQWATGGRYGGQRRLVGELAFLYAAADLVSHTAAGAGEVSAAPSAWPALLACAARAPGHYDEVGVLWAAVLTSPDFYDLAQEILGEWARRVEDDRPGRAALARLLAAAATGPGPERAIRYELARWARGERGRATPKAARDVGVHLDGRNRLP
ncbi:hypothetical protein [Yinghuangia seranimata]|uniref:hypothetical protein n=1 Tax=Yinghuangia seranimata TaxID=408067 RepID=UPI00248AA52C|nr:hypothetical protein [Yinghuangia seranimata]MDI2129829.1 hypothetical protein [Yinghuangia seranimata]